MRTFIKTIVILLFLQAGISSATDKIPFEANPRLHDYSKKSIEALRSKTPTFLQIVKATDDEKEEIFKYLRGKVQKPISIWELILLDYPQLRLLRNEIFARHGYIFDSKDLSTYFNSFTWYKPNPGFSESNLSQSERENISLIRRLEHLKFRKNLSSVKKPNFVAPRDVTAENEFVKVTDSGLIFKATGKQIALKRLYHRHEGQDELAYFSTVSMFDNIPIIFLRNWEHEFLVTGANFGVGIVMYDIYGNLISNVGGGRTLHYIEEMNVFITVSDEGCCGTHYGESFVFDRKGKIKFSSSYGDEGLGNGSIEYYTPIWSSNLLAFVFGEISKSTPGRQPELYNHIAILDSTGKPQIDIRLPSEDSFHGELMELVLLSPDVLYVRSERNDVLIFLKQALHFNPKIDKLFQWKPQEYSDVDLDPVCAEGTKRISISPILNPAILWEKDIPSRLNPIVTIDTIFFTVEGADNNDSIIAVDKLTGKEKWACKMNESVWSITHAQNYLAVRCSSKISLIDKNSGKLIWETINDISKLYRRSHLTLAQKSCVESSFPLVYDSVTKTQPIHILNIYDIYNGRQTKSLNLTELFPMEKSMAYRVPVRHRCLNIASNLVCYSIVEDRRWGVIQSFNRLLIISISDDGNILWSREMPLLSEKAYLQVKNCLIYIIDRGSIVVLDPSSGKTLRELKDGDCDFKISPDTTIVAQRKINWQRMDLQSAFKKYKNYIIIEGDSVRNIIDPTCLVKDYLDDYVYMEDIHPDRFIMLARACQCKSFPGYFSHGETVWHFPPSKGAFSSNPKILHVDHHYILVKTGYRYWAIGEEAVVDYVRRTDGFGKNQN